MTNKATICLNKENKNRNDEILSRLGNLVAGVSTDKHGTKHVYLRLGKKNSSGHCPNCGYLIVFDLEPKCIECGYELKKI